MKPTKERLLNSPGDRLDPPRVLGPFTRYTFSVKCNWVHTSLSPHSPNTVSGHRPRLAPHFPNISTWCLHSGLHALVSRCGGVAVLPRSSQMDSREVQNINITKKFLSVFPFWKQCCLTCVQSWFSLPPPDESVHVLIRGNAKVILHGKSLC